MNPYTDDEHRRAVHRHGEAGDKIITAAAVVACVFIFALPVVGLFQ